MLTTTTAAADIVMFQNSAVTEAYSPERGPHDTTHTPLHRIMHTMAGGNTHFDLIGWRLGAPTRRHPTRSSPAEPKPPPETASVSELQSVLITHLSTEGMHKLHGQRCRAVEHRNIRTSAADAGPERDRHGQLRNSHGGVCLASANTNPASSPTPAWMQCSRNAQ